MRSITVLAFLARNELFKLRVQIIQRISSYAETVDGASLSTVETDSEPVTRDAYIIHVRDADSKEMQ
jgi:hypothetical protein